MGSINSSHRRRRMSSSLDLGTSQREDLATRQEGAEGGHGEESAERNIEDGADSDNEHHDLPSILAYLIRRYLQFPNTYTLHKLVLIALTLQGCINLKKRLSY